MFSDPIVNVNSENKFRSVLSSNYYSILASMHFKIFFYIAEEEGAIQQG